jgi:hypothetical protein
MYFDHGGSALYILRALHSDATASSLQLQGDGPANCTLLSANSAGDHGNTLSVSRTRDDTFIGTVTAIAASPAIAVAQLATGSIGRLYVGAQIRIVDSVNSANKMRVVITKIEPATGKFRFASSTPTGAITTGNVTLEEWSAIMYRAGSVVKRFSQLAMSPLAGKQYFKDAINTGNPADPVVVTTDNSLAATNTVDPRPSVSATSTIYNYSWPTKAGMSNNQTFIIGGTTFEMEVATAGWVPTGGGVVVLDVHSATTAADVETAVHTTINATSGCAFSVATSTAGVSAFTAKVAGAGTATGVGGTVAGTATLVQAGADPGTASMFTGGLDGTTPNDADHYGSSVNGTGLFAFDGVDDINQIAIPGRCTAAVHQAIDAWCDARALTGRPVFGIKALNDGQTAAQEIAYVTTTANLYTNNASIYTPWVKITDPVTGFVVNFPPECAVMGVYARTDATRGVQKAPAGTPDGQLVNVAGLARKIKTAEYDTLYPVNINAILAIKGRGICIFGSRTLASDQFNQIPIRRVFNWVKMSLRDGTMWVNFENNDDALRARVRKSVNVFLLQAWRAGKLKGAKASEAFYVVCDASNNQPSDEIAGKLKVRVGLAVAHPAEFVEWTLEQDTRALDQELAAAGLS